MQPFHLESITAGADCAVLRITGEVDFLDSTGLGALVGSLKRLREQDGTLELITSAAKILMIFRLTGLVRVFAIHSSLPEAIAGDRHWEAALAREGRGTTEWCREHELL